MPLCRPANIFAIVMTLISTAGVSRAQSIVAAPASLTFMAQSRGATTTPQVVSITSSGANFNFSAEPGAPWLYVTQSSGAAPGTISVAVNPATLAAGSYSSMVTIRAPGLANSPLTIPVTATITAALQATIAPAVLTFTSQNGATPPAQTLNIATNGPPTNFVITPVSTGNWLSVDKTTGATPADVAVSVNLASLTPGVYNGSLVVTVPGAVNGAFTVGVTLSFTGSPTLTFSPGPLNFNYQVGQALPPAQQISVAAGGAALNFSATPTTSMGGAWLVANTTSGVTPATVGIGVDPSRLPVGVYTGSVTIAAPGAANSLSVPVTLTVNLNPLLNVSPSSVAFNFTTTGPVPAPQTIALSSTGGPLPFTAAVSTGSGGPWLQVAPATGTTPASLTITADPTGLPQGTYAGSVTLTLTGAGVNTVVVPVTLSVNTLPMLTASPSPLSFVFQNGGSNPAPQTIAVGSTIGVLNFTSSFATNTGGSWLTATGSGATPGQITVTANPSAFPLGIFSGVVTITAPGASNSPLQVPVNLTVSNSPLLFVTPPLLTFSSQSGGAAPATQNITVGSTTPGIGITLSAIATDGNNWLSLSQNSGITPATIGVVIAPAALRAGTYTGSITIGSSAAGNTPLIVPVTLTLSSAAITVSPSALVFNQTASGAAPAVQTLSALSPGNIVPLTATALTTTGGNWLSVTPSTGATPAQFAVAVNGAGLAQGTYSGLVNIAPGGPAAGIQSVPVTLVVGPAQNLAVSPAALSFSYLAGGPVPAVQTVAVSGTTALPFTVAATATGGNWLAVSPVSGTTPGNVAVSLTPAGLAAGTYTGTVTIASGSASNSPQTVAVTLVVTAIPPPSLTALVNAASFFSGRIAPGEIVTLGGTGIGPATLAGLQLTSSGTVDTMVANTRVLIDNIPAPIVYASATQTSVVVPYALQGRITAQAQVIYNGVASNLFPVTIAASAPGIFTQNSAGNGQGSILNENGSVNSPSNPTTQGRVIVIYATGEGITNPPGSDGAVTTGLKSPVLPVTVTIGKQPARVNFAGSAPGFVSGALQVNAVVPAGAGTGNVEVVVKVGDNPSQPNVTVALQ